MLIGSHPREPTYYWTEFTTEMMNQPVRDKLKNKGDTYYMEAEDFLVLDSFEITNFKNTLQILVQSSIDPLRVVSIYFLWLLHLTRIYNELEMGFFKVFAQAPNREESCNI